MKDPVIKIARKDLDFGNVRLTDALKLAVSWKKIPLEAMRSIGVLEERIEAIRKEFDVLKKKKIDGFGGSISEVGRLVFPDGKEKEAKACEKELNDYFNEEEDFNFSRPVVPFSDDLGLDSKWLRALDPFIDFK